VTDEIVKLIVGTGVGGIIGAIALWQLHGFRKEHRADLLELRDALGNLPDHLQAIHSRLGSLGADSIPAPVAPGRRRRRAAPAGKLERLRTAPTGVPVTIDPEHSTRHDTDPHKE
jgi:hypothetical protein